MPYNARVQHSYRADRDDVSSTWQLRLPTSFYFLVSETTGLPVQPVLDYLSDEFVPRIRSRTFELKRAKETLKARAYDLFDFLCCLDHMGVSIEDVNEHVFNCYLDSMATTLSTATGKPFAQQTIIRRRDSVASLLKYCQKAGRLKHRFRVDLVETPSGKVEVFAPNVAAPTALPRDHNVKAIEPKLLQLVMRSFGPDPVDEKDGLLEISSNQSLLRLMAEISLQTGLRRTEVCDLTVEKFEEIDLDGRRPLGSIAIQIRGKGSKARSVPFPVWLINALQNYIRNDRATVVGRAIIGSAKFLAPKNVFLNETDKLGVMGTVITPRQFNRLFHQSLLELIGSIEDYRVRERLLRNNISVHSLRHTFALVTYIERRRQGDVDPTKYVQAVLGHSNRTTTEQMYLDASHIFESELSEQMETAISGYIHA